MTSDARPILIPKWTSPWAWAPLAVALAAFLLTMNGEWNLRAFHAVNGIGPSPWDPLWANITVFGDTLVVGAVVFPLWRRRPDLLWSMAIAVGIAALLVQAVKPFADMPRPTAVLTDGVHVIGPAYRKQSFPSGHAATAFAVAGVIGAGLRARFVHLAALVGATAVGVSRVVVGVHWPRDVAAGAVVGCVAATAGLLLGARFAFGARGRVRWALAAVFAGCCIAKIAGHDGGLADARWTQRAVGAAALVVGAVVWAIEGRRGVSSAP